MKTVRAWFVIPKVWNMLPQLSSPHLNGQSKVIPTKYNIISVSNYLPMKMVRAWWFPLGMKRASLVGISCQRSEHGDNPLRYETCLVSWHPLMPTIRAWWYPLRYETCSVSCHRLMTTAPPPRVWNMLPQLLSSSDNSQGIVIAPSGWTWSVSCHHLMTTVRA